MIVQVSPYGQVRRWEMRGDVGSADSAPFISIAFGGWQWSFYGLLAWIKTGRTGFLVLVQSNILGALLGTYYTIAFWLHCQSELGKLSFQRYLSSALALVIFEVSTFAVLTSERQLLIVGLISAFCSFVSAMSILITVPSVVRSKDSRTIPGPIAVSSAFSSTCWTVCGILLHDELIAVPSCLNLFASSICVCLKILYPSSESESEASPCGKGACVDYGAVDNLCSVKIGNTEDVQEDPQLLQNGCSAMDTFGRSIALPGSGTGGTS